MSLKYGGVSYVFDVSGGDFLFCAKHFLYTLNMHTMAFARGVNGSEH